MKTLINIGSKQSRKNLTKLAVFIGKVFKSGQKTHRQKEEVIAALELAVKAFCTTISGCTLSSGEKLKK